MSRQPPGVPAPWLCMRCKCALWWADKYADRPAVLVDVRGRQRCRPLTRYGYRLHYMSQRQGVKR